MTIGYRSAKFSRQAFDMGICESVRYCLFMRNNWMEGFKAENKPEIME